MAKVKITSHQYEVYQFIMQYWERAGIGPTYREIQTHFNFASPNTAYYHVRNLKKKGLITSDRRERSIKPVGMKIILPGGEK